MNKSIPRKNKYIAIGVSASVIIGITLLIIFPNKATTCGALDGESACTTQYCIGFITIDNHIPPSSHCIGIDMGTDYSIIPYNKD